LATTCERTESWQISNEIRSFHPTGANYLYGDGSVRLHSETIEPETVVSLFTWAAGDLVRWS
jgi:prepilin-type processing-associated H-X9-DG protein